MASAGLITRSIPQYTAQMERLRRAIPAHVYLALLDKAAQTGYMPRLDPHGHATGEFDSMTGKDRLNLLMALVNKCVPDRAEQTPLPEELAKLGGPIDVTKMETHELESLIAAGPVSAGPAGTPEAQGPAGDAAS